MLLRNTRRSYDEVAGLASDPAAPSASQPADTGAGGEDVGGVIPEAPGGFSRISATDDMSASGGGGRCGPRTPSRFPSSHEVDVPADLREQIELAMGRYPEIRSAALPALWAVQRHYGWCSPEGIRQAAAVMGVTPAYLESLTTFYDLYRTSPVGRHQVLVCHNISCWLRGADDLMSAFSDAAGVDRHEADHGGASSPDGEVFLKGFECMGACDIAPMASIDDRYYGPLSLDDAATVIEQLRQGAEVMPDKALAERGAAGGPEPDPDPRVEGAEG